MVHLTNNFISSKVHRKLIESMAGLEKQYVFVPVRNPDDVGVNDSDNLSVEVVYLQYHKFLKFLPFIKVLYVSFMILMAVRRHPEISAEHQKMILAHNMWSDGVPALFCGLFLKFKYALVVRNTDINVFIPRLLYLRWLMSILIKKCNILIFVSEAHRNRFSANWPKLFSLAKFVTVIPNGVDSFWLEFASKKLSHREVTRPKTVAYVGRFDKNKNIYNLYQALSNINRRYSCSLLLIGGTERELKALCNIKEALPEWVKVREWISDLDELARELSRCRVFAMPSFHETFGLVYIEALSCGCSLIHSKNEGIDGFFDEKFIRSVNPYDVNDIEANIMFLMSQFPAGVRGSDVERLIEKFEWGNVARNYRAILG